MKKVVILLFFSTFLLADSNVSGKVFFNHTTDLDENGMNAFKMKRAYLSYANSVSDDLFYNVTYDMGNNDGGSAFSAFLKVAMLRWKTNLGDVTLGMQGMNMFKTMENTWGHRFIAKMPMDTYGFSSSADLGVGLSRSFGAVSTSALITNGGGYKMTETDSHKKLSFHAVYGETKLNNNAGFNVGASFSYESYDQEIIGDFDYDPNTIMPEDSTMISLESSGVLGLFGGYSGNGIRAGLEYDKKGIKGQNSQIISAYATVKVLDKISILGRFDQFDANTDFDGGLEQSIIAGVHYNAENGLTIAPTLRITRPEEGDTENSIVVNFQFKF
jgi:hypothetical protein